MCDNAYCDPTSVFESDMSDVSTEWTTEYHAVKVKSLPIVNDIEFYIYKLHFSPYDS